MKIDLCRASLIAVISDPISTGGDYNTLAKIYISNNGKWQRIGARSTARSDLPANLDLGHSPTDNNFEFDGYVALRRPGEGPTYLVVSHGDRVINHAFDGYRVYEIDPAHSALRLMDKWNNEGAKVYAAFKRAKESDGGTIFEPDVETDELGKSCEHITEPNPGLTAACGQLKR